MAAPLALGGWRPHEVTLRQTVTVACTFTSLVWGRTDQGFRYMFDLTDPNYSDETAAREHLEGIRWADGVYCPRCDRNSADDLSAGPSQTVHQDPAEN